MSLLEMLCFCALCDSPYVKPPFALYFCKYVPTQTNLNKWEMRNAAHCAAILPHLTALGLKIGFRNTAGRKWLFSVSPFQRHDSEWQQRATCVPRTWQLTAAALWFWSLWFCKLFPWPHQPDEKATIKNSLWEAACDLLIVLFYISAQRGLN